MQIENRMVVDSEFRHHAKPQGLCSDCDKELFDGYTYYNVFGKIMCENCFDSYVKEEFRRVM